MRGEVPGWLPAAWTAFALVAIAFRLPVVLGSAWLGLAIAITIRTGSARAITGAMRWSLPFLPMLVLIHAVLNPSHHESVRLSGIVPWRPDGFLLAVTTFASLALLALAAMGWREVRASRLFDDCLRAGLPLRVVVMVAAAASSLDVIRRRIAITYLAQQARGLPSGPGLMARLRALPAVVIPVVTGAITDGAGQGDVMVTRGLGLVPITVDAKGSAGLSPSDAIAAAFPILVTIAAMVIA